jgi:GNAT superfamily N-acetyltransferase
MIILTWHPALYVKVSKIWVLHTMLVAKLCCNKKNLYMKIEHCNVGDIDEIFRLYAIASAYQQTKNVVVWPNFERRLVETEIAENRQWKLLIDGAVACNWAITFSDAEIWEHRENGCSIYIHRIATSPAYRGNNFVKRIVEWAKEYAKDTGKNFVRLDTLGYNVKLIEHYINAGFEFIGMFRLKNTNRLPLHYQKQPDCCLFEMKV